MKQQILSFLPGDHPWQNQIYWFDTIDSTNTRAKEMAAQGAPHGTVLIAGHQTAGRGRLGRSFQSPAGLGVYMSVILRPNCPPEQLMHLTCASAVAMCDAVAKVTGKRPGIKWTNDLVMEKRKIAGILTELSVNPKNGLVDYAIVGVGINCGQKTEDFPLEIRSFAGSLSMVTGKEILPSRMAAAMVAALHRMDAALFFPVPVLMRQYRSDCITVGHDVSLVRGDEVRHGHAVGITDTGALVVRFADGHTEAINSGEISVRGLYGYV